MKSVLGMSMVVLMLLGALGVAAQAEDRGLVGKPAPEISAGSWINTAPVSLAGCRGKVVVVEFWATWCPPCRASIPHLSKMFKTYSQSGVQFVSLTNEERSAVEPFVKAQKMEYPIGVGSRSAEAYGVEGIPHAVVIDRDGKVSWEGHPMDEAFEAAVKKAMATR